MKDSACFPELEGNSGVMFGAGVLMIEASFLSICLSARASYLACSSFGRLSNSESLIPSPVSENPSFGAFHSELVRDVRWVLAHQLMLAN